MTRKKEKSNVSSNTPEKGKNLPRKIVYLSGTEKEIEGLAPEYQIALKTIIHTRLAYDLAPGVSVERLQGAAKGKKLDELKIKSKESVRCFYSLRDDSVLVAIVFAKKQEGQATKEIKIAIKRLKDYEKQKK
ncbi:hypothetical protein [Delftia acidovorans]